MRKFFAAILLQGILALVSYAASLDGKWNFAFQTEEGVREATINLQVDGAEVKGKVLGLGEGDIDVKGTCSGDEVSLAFPYHSEEAGAKAEVKIKGKLDADTIKGGWQFDNHAGDFTAKRAR